mmetsp:Transcript_1336/g.3863  ORF Transcript_1336/g.3863 Transcript_1336/m.3863 type:complete len:470 (+) Transcript_1336:173-1582(+)
MLTASTTTRALPGHFSVHRASPKVFVHAPPQVRLSIHGRKELHRSRPPSSCRVSVVVLAGSKKNAQGKNGKSFKASTMVELRAEVQTALLKRLKEDYGYQDLFAIEYPEVGVDSLFKEKKLYANVPKETIVKLLKLEEQLTEGQVQKAAATVPRSKWRQPRLMFECYLRGLDMTGTVVALQKRLKPVLEAQSEGSTQSDFTDKLQQLRELHYGWAATLASISIASRSERWELVKDFENRLKVEIAASAELVASTADLMELKKGCDKQDEEMSTVMAQIDDMVKRRQAAIEQEKTLMKLFVETREERKRQEGVLLEEEEVVVKAVDAKAVDAAAAAKAAVKAPPPRPATTIRPTVMPPSAARGLVATASAANGGSVSAGAVAGGGSGSGPSAGAMEGSGRTQSASARSPVPVPTEVIGNPVVPKSSPSPTPGATATGGGRWDKFKEPEAVGLVFALVTITLFDGIRSALK